jgi:8-amino-7-oxononanoate synthase
VQRFREKIARLGLSATGGAFPVQTLARVAGIDTAALHAGLLQRQVRTVLHSGTNAPGARLSFILTAVQTANCIDRAVDALAETVTSLNGRAVACAPRWRVS